MKTLSIIKIEGKFFNQANEELTLVPREAKRRTAEHLTDANGEIVAKCCTTCNEMKIATKEFFYVDGRRFAGLKSKCKTCLAKQEIESANRVKRAQKPPAKRYYNEAGECYAKECPGCSQLKERSQFGAYSPNPDGMQPYCTDCDSVYRNNNRATKAGISATLTFEEWLETRQAFEGRCALTGEETDVVFEHALPVSKNGGTTAYNCYPVSAALNRSKFTKHFYEWAEEVGIDKVRFDRLIKHLADRCGLTPEAYRDYYDWAYVTDGDVSISSYNRKLA